MIEPDGTPIVDIDPQDTDNKVVPRTADLFKTNFFATGEAIALAAKNSTTVSGTCIGVNTRMSARAGHAITEPGGFSHSVPVLGFVGSGFTVVERCTAEDYFGDTGVLKRGTLLAALASISLVLWLIARSIARASRCPISSSPILICPAAMGRRFCDPGGDRSNRGLSPIRKE